MNTKHEVIDLFGHKLDTLTDPQNGIRIAVSREGAELVSLARRDEHDEWIGFLYRDGDVDKAREGWGNHCTVMGFYTHRLLNGESEYRDQKITGGNHSFLRHKLFDAPEVAISEPAASLTYYIGPKQFRTEEYPLNVSLELTYTLEDDTLKVTFRFTNHEPDLAAHLSFGLHPGFAATSADSWQLLMPKGRYIRHLAPDNFLSGETEAIDFEGGPMPFANRDLPGSFLLEMEKVELPLFIFADKPSGRQVYLNYSGAPYVTIWNDGNPFLCVEPCWGLPDAKPQTTFQEKPGIQEIQPGNSFDRTITISPKFDR